MNTEIKPGQTWISRSNKEPIITRAIDPMTLHAWCGFQADPVWYVDLYAGSGWKQQTFTTSYIHEYYVLESK